MLLNFFSTPIPMISLSAYKSCLVIYKLIEGALESWGYRYYSLFNWKIHTSGADCHQCKSDQNKYIEITII